MLTGLVDTSNRSLNSSVGGLIVIEVRVVYFLQSDRHVILVSMTHVVF